MRWMQISDLHIKRCADWEIMKKSYIKAIPKEDIDFIIVTGDLHNHDEDYSETEKFLNEIMEATKLTKSDFFIVPGNHDSKDFKYKGAFINDILSNINKDSEYYKKYRVELKDAFQEYIEFYKEQFVLEEYELENVQLTTWRDKINIIEINSALVSDGENSHKQIIDILDLAGLRINNGLPTIAIGHHEISYFFDEHQNIFKRVLTDLNVAAYLCGDLHRNATNSVVNYSSSNKVIPSIVCGKSAIDNVDTYSDNSFIIYDYDESSIEEKVVVTLYKWNATKKNFYKSNDLDTDEGAFEFPLYPSGKNENVKKESKKENKVKEVDSILKLQGYTLIGPRGNNGIKYVWRKNNQIVESLAFNKRINDVNLAESDNNTSAYTSSISHGCILCAENLQCIFCETGKNAFGGYLTAEDIALQNIFMAEYDSDCPSYPEVRKHLREFAYMGQGEPGHAYHLIRRSIQLTDYAMDCISQDISRYIISTCGINGFVPLLVNDIKNNCFKNRISLHFSLNAVGEDRDMLMPINRTNDFEEFIKECEPFFEVTGEKVAVSIIIFNGLEIKDMNFSYSLTKEKIKEILKFLNPEKFRIDLRDFNSNNIIRLKGVSNEYATNLLNEVQSKGFETKLFSCFGENEKAACGMLASSIKDIMEPGATTLAHFNRAVELLSEARKNI